MEYNSVAEIAVKWNTSERSVRNYCAAGRVDGAVLVGKTWHIPVSAKKPERLNKKDDAKFMLTRVLLLLIPQQFQFMQIRGKPFDRR